MAGTHKELRRHGKKEEEEEGEEEKKKTKKKKRKKGKKKKYKLRKSRLSCVLSLMRLFASSITDMPHVHCMLVMGSSICNYTVCDSFISPNQSQTPRFFSAPEQTELVNIFTKILTCLQIIGLRAQESCAIPRIRMGWSFTRRWRRRSVMFAAGPRYHFQTCEPFS